MRWKWELCGYARSSKGRLKFVCLSSMARSCDRKEVNELHRSIHKRDLRSNPPVNWVQNVQAVQAVQTPSFILPRGRGGGKRWGLQRLERLEQLEQIGSLKYRPIGRDQRVLLLEPHLVNTRARVIIEVYLSFLKAPKPGRYCPSMNCLIPWSFHAPPCRNESWSLFAEL